MTKRDARMTPQRWEATKAYVAEVFGEPDEQLASLMPRAVKAGLPDIAVSPDVGRLLALLVSTTAGRRAVELGTLGGYSAIWIARALRPDGKLVTVEQDEKAAAFAAREIVQAKLEDRVAIERSPALEALPKIAASFGPGSIDFAFVDADKTEYPTYWSRLRVLIAIGGYFVADNALGTSSWWIDHEDSEARQSVDALNRAVAADESFQSVLVTQREGLLVARRVR